jgi:hypothetical protein
MKQPNGLAVIGVFIDVIDPPSNENSANIENIPQQMNQSSSVSSVRTINLNEEVQKLSNLMEKVQFKGQNASIGQPISITQLMPSSTSSVRTHVICAPFLSAKMFINKINSNCSNRSELFHVRRIIDYTAVVRVGHLDCAQDSDSSLGRASKFFFLIYPD